MTIENRTIILGCTLIIFMLTDVHCGYFHSKIYHNHLVKVFFSLRVLFLCIVSFRSMPKGSKRNGLLVKSITASHHHHHHHHQNHSLTTFCFFSCKSCGQGGGNVKNRNMLIHLSTYHNIYMTCCYFPFCLFRYSHS